MTGQEILFEVADGVGIITLNRPDKLNAFTKGMVDRWASLLRDASTNPSVNVVVVTGAGRAFCAGGDIDDMRTKLDRPGAVFKEYLYRHVHEIAFALDRLDKPVICALNGTARGAGLDMALMCDLRYAAQSAKFAESYINVGLVAGDGGTYFLPRLIGTARALEMFWTGREVGAAEAEQMGFVNKVVPDAELMPTVMELARRIASQPQEAVRYFKRAVYQSTTMSLPAHLDMVSSHMAVLQGTDDHRQKVLAFLERRSKKG